MSLHRLPIRVRLRLGVVVCVALLALLGLVSLIDLKSVDAGVGALAGDVLPRLALADATAEGAQAVRQDQFRRLAAGSVKHKAEVAVELGGHEAAVERAFARYRRLRGDHLADRHFDAALAAWRAYLERTRGFLDATGGDRASMLDAASPVWERLGVAEADWHRQIRAEAGTVARSTHATFRRSGLISFGLTALGIMVAAAVWFALGRLDAPETASAEPAAAAGPAPPEGATAWPEAGSPVAAGGESAGIDGTLSLARDAVSDQTGDVLIDPLFSTDRLDGAAGTITQLAETASLLALQATTEADFGGGAGPGLALVADSVRTLAADAQAAAARASARLDGLRVSQSVKVITELAATFRGLVEQSHSIAVDIAVEAARAGEEGHNFDEIAAEVDRMTGELEARAGQVDEVLADIRPNHVSELHGVQ